LEKLLYNVISIPGSPPKGLEKRLQNIELKILKRKANKRNHFPLEENKDVMFLNQN